MHNLFLICNVIIPLFIGAIIYYLIDPSVVFVRWIDTLTGIGYHVNLSCKYLFWKLIRNYLFDYIWSYSLVFAIAFVYSELSLQYIAFITITLGTVLELFQIFDGFPGTFDYIDIFVQIFSALLALLFVYLERRHYCEEKN